MWSVLALLIAYCGSTRPARAPALCNQHPLYAPCRRRRDWLTGLFHFPTRCFARPSRLLWCGDALDPETGAAGIAEASKHHGSAVEHMLDRFSTASENLVDHFTIPLAVSIAAIARLGMAGEAIRAEKSILAYRKRERFDHCQDHVQNLTCNRSYREPLAKLLGRVGITAS